MKLSTFDEISALDTEKINPEFENIDISSTEEILKLINSQDKLVPNAVAAELPNITKAVEAIVNAFQNGGRLIYVGAGTSGRLGVLDASECPPTFGSAPEMVQGIIAGGKEAAFRAIEGAEDISENGEKIIENLNVNFSDVVCGITASGRTPFVISALNQAKKNAAFTILISTNNRKKIEKMQLFVDKNSKKNSQNKNFIDVMICPNVGAEIVAGSTRMKSGTAQKLILNMLSTTAMIKIGKTYKNIMVDLKPTNIKLQQRAKRILMEITNVDLRTAEKILEKTNYNVKSSLIMLILNVNLQTAEELLKQKSGKIRNIIEKI
jgi:N-acetylmuramic acid 6-phosphate etherase